MKTKILLTSNIK